MTLASSWQKNVNSTARVKCYIKFANSLPQCPHPLDTSSSSPDFPIRTINKTPRHPIDGRGIVMTTVVSISNPSQRRLGGLGIMRSAEKRYIATRAVTYACLVTAGVGISDQLLSGGSFFQSAGAQQVRQAQQGQQGQQGQQVKQAQQPQRPRQIPAVRPTAATPAAESATPTASCDQQFPRTDLVLPGPKGPIKLDSCYRGREHFICSVNAIIAESQKLRSEYDTIVQMNYPSFKTIDPVCKLSSEGVATDIQLVNDFFPRFRAVKAAFERQANCAMGMGRTIKELNLSTMANGADIAKSMMEAIDGDMKRVPDERQNSSDLSDTIEAARKALDAIEKLHAAMCPAAQTKGATLR
jgi:hypothetical protein